MLTVLALAEFLGMTLWFSATAVTPALVEQFHVAPDRTAWLTMAVQAGFVVGTLGAAILNLADILNARVLLFLGALGGAAANASVIWATNTESVIALRFLTGVALACVYPPGMKLAAGWFRDSRGFALGILIGALTLGKAVAGLNAQSKGKRLGIFGEPKETSPGKPERKKPRARVESVSLLGRSIPIVQTGEGVRAVVKDRAEDPRSVERYLQQKLGTSLPDAIEAMRRLAKAYSPKVLDSVAYSLYEEFRPAIPEGAKGWGAKGRLDLSLIRALARNA